MEVYGIPAICVQPDLQWKLFQRQLSCGGGGGLVGVGVAADERRSRARMDLPERYFAFWSGNMLMKLIEPCHENHGGSWPH